MTGNKLKLLWNRLKHNHLLLLALCCLAPVGLIAVWLYFFKGRGDAWVWLIILLCPLLHVWMMRKHGDGGGDNK